MSRFSPKSRGKLLDGSLRVVDTGMGDGVDLYETALRKGTKTLAGEVEGDGGVVDGLTATCSTDAAGNGSCRTG